MKGPALYAYNDAVFSEDDWKGIRMLLQSVKQHDQHKIGYFGMGFKSVFHITGMHSNNNNNNNNNNNLIHRAVIRAEIPSSKEPLGLSRDDGKPPMV